MALQADSALTNSVPHRRTTRLPGSLTSVLEAGVRPGCVDDLPADHRQQRFNAADFAGWNRHVVLCQHGKVREFAGCERASLVFIAREPGAAKRIETQSVRASWSLFRPA